MKAQLKLKTVILPAALMVGIPLFFSACVPQLSGEEGNLALSYEKGPISAAKGSSPLAVGAKLTYSANEDGDKDKKKLPIHKAISSDDSVIAVDEVTSRGVTLEALNPGEITLDVEASDREGERVTDTFGLSAKEVDKVAVGHLCGPHNDDKPVYMTDQDIELKYTMYHGTEVAVGYGYYPIEVSPAGGANLREATRNGVLAVRTGADRGVVSLNSTVEEKADFELNLVDATKIVRVGMVEGDAFEDQSLSPQVGKTMLLHLAPQAKFDQDERPVCQFVGEVETSVDTPDICEVSYGEFESGDDVLDLGVLMQLYDTHGLNVRGKAVGQCDFTVTIPQANDGEGASLDYSLEFVGESEED